MKYKFKKEEAKYFLPFYKKMGFFVIEDLFEKDELKEISSVILKMNDNKSHSLKESLKEVFDRSFEEYIGLLKAFSRSSIVQNFFLEKKIEEVIKELGFKMPSTVSTPVSHVVDKDLNKTGVADVILGYHQDWASVQGSMNLVTAWIPLVDVKENTYPVQIIPGSHLSGISREDVKKRNIVEIEKEKIKKSPVDILLNKGDIAFFSGYTIHRTKPDGEEFRIALSQRYEDLMEPTFKKRFYYCAYERTVNRDIKYFPKKEEILRVIGDLDED